MTTLRALGHEGTGCPRTKTEKENYTFQGSTLGQPRACGEQKGEPTVERGRNVSWCPSTAGSHVASLGLGQEHRQTSNQRVERETPSIWLLQITASRKLHPMSISRTNSRMPSLHQPHPSARSAAPFSSLKGKAWQPPNNSNKLLRHFTVCKVCKV